MFATAIALGLSACGDTTAGGSGDPSTDTDPVRPPEDPVKTPDPDDGEPLPGTPVDRQYAPQQVLVRFKSGTQATVTRAVHDTHQARVLRTYRVPSNLQLVELPEALGVEQAIAQYRKDPNVLYVQPNFRYQITEMIPDDPSFSALWGMHNLGDDGVFDADIDAPEAWDITTGSPDVILGVHDTGIDYDHEDLFENVFWNPGEIPDNGVDDDGNGFVDDLHGINALEMTGDPRDDHSHGTHVSGTIAARGNNATGVVGVNWDARVVSCKSFDAGGGGYDDAILTCMDYFLALKTRTDNPVNIIATNNSWSGGGFSPALLDAIEAHGQAGMLFVAAASNDYGNNNDENPVYPASYESANIIAVAATDAWDGLAWFSNYGPRSVDVGAPGANVLSSVPGDRYEFFDGTSMATPHVTGLVGLLKAFDPTLTPEALKNLVMTGGDETPGTLGLTLSGRRINAFGSLTCENRPLYNRFAPSANPVTVSLGEPVALGVLSIVCAQPNPEAQTVTVRETGEVIQLMDASGGGIFEGSFTPADFGTFTLEFSMGDVVTVNVVRNYDPARIIDFEYRDITGTRLPLEGWSYATVYPPFPIRFGDVQPGYEVVVVGGNGVISFTDTPYDYWSPLPQRWVETIVAPLWTELVPEWGGGVFYDVLGTAPNRELVIEWEDVPSYESDGSVTFQVVFFENSPNLLFNYADVIFGDRWMDNGGNANIGVQVSSSIARQFSFHEPSLRDEMSLLWSMGAPIAVAGPDQVVTPGQAVELDGSASQDFDGSIAFHAWAQLSGTPVLIQGANKAVAGFTAPQASGALTFQLSVVDDEGQIGSDTTSVIVNRHPVADAGDDFLLANHLTGTLDGTGSSDPDGVIVGYRWRQISGEAVAIFDAETATATFTAPATPQYLVFELTVRDEYGFAGTDYVVVEIFANDSPVAVAGADRLVRPGDVISLDGSASYDPDGSIARYRWETTLCMTVDGPCVIDIVDANTANPVVELPASVGFVHFRLTVTDNAGATASDSMTIVLFYQEPHAVITPIESCTNSGSTITLDGSQSFDLDGEIVSYRWQQRAGTPVALSNPSAAQVTFTAPSVQGTLVFALTVTDDDDRTGTAEIALTVNTPPVADARASVLAALAGQTVTLDGSLSQDAAAYAWVQTSGTPAALANPSAAVTSFVAPNPAAGRFEIATFALTVTDGCGASATDTVSVVIVGN